jgi:ArsR family transcriptional regulator
MSLRDCTDQEVENLLILFKALSNPLRLDIARMVCMRPRYGYEIEEEFDCERTNITKHVNILKNAGILKAYKEGRKTLFVMQAGYIKSLLECLDPEKHVTIDESK